MASKLSDAELAFLEMFPPATPSGKGAGGGSITIPCSTPRRDELTSSDEQNSDDRSSDGELNDRQPGLPTQITVAVAPAVKISVAAPMSPTQLQQDIPSPTLAPPLAAETANQLPMNNDDNDDDADFAAQVARAYVQRQLFPSTPDAHTVVSNPGTSDSVDPPPLERHVWPLLQLPVASSRPCEAPRAARPVPDVAASRLRLPQREPIQLASGAFSGTLLLRHVPPSFQLAHPHSLGPRVPLEPPTEFVQLHIPVAQVTETPSELTPSVLAPPSPLTPGAAQSVLNKQQQRLQQWMTPAAVPPVPRSRAPAQPPAAHNTSALYASMDEEPSMLQANESWPGSPLTLQQLPTNTSMASGPSPLFRPPIMRDVAVNTDTPPAIVPAASSSSSSSVASAATPTRPPPPVAAAAAAKPATPVKKTPTVRVVTTATTTAAATPPPPPITQEQRVVAPIVGPPLLPLHMLLPPPQGQNRVAARQFVWVAPLCQPVDVGNIPTNGAIVETFTAGKFSQAVPVTDAATTVGDTRLPASPGIPAAAASMSQLSAMSLADSRWNVFSSGSTLTSASVAASLNASSVLFKSSENYQRLFSRLAAINMQLAHIEQAADEVFGGLGDVAASL